MLTAQHVQQANHNALLNAHLDLETTPFVDWNVTATFYEAVHYVDAYCIAANGRRTYADHDGRITWMKSALPADVFKAYRRLLDHSRRARYDALHTTYATPDGRTLAKTLRALELEAIKTHLRSQGLTIP